MTTAAYHRQYYARNAATICASRRRRDAETMRQQREYVSEWKAARGCSCCGITDPVVLDLDHTEPRTKRDNVSSMCGRVSWDTLFAEIAKCVVLCANCHRRKTHASKVHMGECPPCKVAGPGSIPW